MSAGAVHVPPLRHNLLGVVVPLAVWVVVFGGRVLCRTCQRAIPLVAYVVPLPLPDTAALLAHRPR